MAGTVSQTLIGTTKHKILQVQWLSATGGTVSAASTAENVNHTLRGMYCVLAITDPGATTAPTNNYDIAINDSFGCDVFGGALENRASGSAEQCVPTGGNGDLLGPGRPIFTGLSIAITGNTVAAASGALYVVFME